MHSLAVHNLTWLQNVLILNRCNCASFGVGCQLAGPAPVKQENPITIIIFLWPYCTYSLHSEMILQMPKKRANKNQLIGILQDCSVCWADMKADLVCAHPSWENLKPCIQALIKTFPNCKICFCDFAKLFKNDICWFEILLSTWYYTHYLL